jgi:hypothetical protein
MRVAWRLAGYRSICGFNQEKETYTGGHTDPHLLSYHLTFTGGGREEMVSAAAWIRLLG